MKKIGYVLGAVSFVWMMACGGAEFSGPFFPNVLIILIAVLLGIGGLLFSVRLIHIAEEREKRAYGQFMVGRAVSLKRRVKGMRQR